MASLKVLNSICLALTCVPILGKRQEADSRIEVDHAGRILQRQNCGEFAFADCPKDGECLADEDTKSCKAKEEEFDEADEAKFTTHLQYLNPVAGKKACPKHTIQHDKHGEEAEPDPHGNCECKQDYVCYENSVVAKLTRFAEEMRDDSAMVQIQNLIDNDSMLKTPGCPINGEASASGPVPRRGSMVRFHYSCQWCRCQKDTGEFAHEKGDGMSTAPMTFMVTILVCAVWL